MGMRLGVGSGPGRVDKSPLFSICLVRSAWSVVSPNICS